MKSVRRCLLAAALPSVGILAGCSLITIDGPPAGHETMASFECDEGRGPAWFDLAVAGLSVAGAFTAEDDPESEWWGWSADTKMVGGFAMAGLFGASAWSGFSRTSRCRDARRRFVEALEDQLPLGEVEETNGPGAIGPLRSYDAPRPQRSSSRASVSWSGTTTSRVRLEQ